MPDRIFDERRLADIYDDLDSDRRDLAVYLSIAGELGARSVLDVGCGTGTFAAFLPRRGSTSSVWSQPPPCSPSHAGRMGPTSSSGSRRRA